jgi:ADP-heptose:LPS heptosyltransferase
MQTANRLRRESFDAAIILRNDFWWGGMLAYLAGIPKRYGYRTPESALYLTKALPFPESVHVTDQSIDLISNFCVDSGVVGCRWEGGPRLEPAPTDLEQAAAILEAHGLRLGEPFAVIHPGAGADIKLWNARWFGEIAHFLAATYGLKIALTGSAAETSLLDEVTTAGGIPVVSLAGSLSIRQLAAAMKLAQLAVGVDSGPMHLAAAVGTPTVHLFGPSDPALFGPRGEAGRHLVVSSSYPCVPCCDLSARSNHNTGGECMSAIDVQMVEDAIRRLLGEGNR